MYGLSRPKFCVFLMFLACFLLVILQMRQKNGQHFVLTKDGRRKWSKQELSQLPWYLSVGTVRPKPTNNTFFQNVWPENNFGDRIVDQLMINPVVPLNIVKTIYVPFNGFDVKHGRSYFQDKCVFDNCEFVMDASTADAVVFKDQVGRQRINVPQSQIWILYVLESAQVSGLEVQEGSINMTATYRRDSDIVTPYEKWVYYDQNFRKIIGRKNWAAGKTKQVAWFVSNCQTNNGRLDYAQELQKYIDVDIYGACGTLKCDRDDENKCYEMLKKEYRFYLAFENTNCRDYITEKFFVNGLQNDVIPIVMGAHPADYKEVAPEHSYIHVEDFPSARDLADYLQLLSSDDRLYNSYFEWKGTGEFIDTRFFCRLCSMLHAQHGNKHYSSFREWWMGPKGTEVCRDNNWIN